MRVFADDWFPTVSPTWQGLELQAKSANVWHPELSPAEIAFLDIFMSLVDLGEQSPHAQKRQQSEHELDGNIWWSS